MPRVPQGCWLRVHPLRRTLTILTLNLCPRTAANIREIGEGSKNGMIRHQVSIRTSASRLYGALTTENGIGGWWDKPTASNSHAGVTWEFRPGAEHGVLQMRVIDAIPDRRVEWECISAHPANSPAFAWTGTHVIFEIAERNGTCTLSFRHTGWDENDEYFGFCNYNWGVALHTLKAQCESQPQNGPSSVAQRTMGRAYQAGLIATVLLRRQI